MENFSEVAVNDLYRGGRPSTSDFQGPLRTMGGIINLEGDDVAGAEYKALRDLRLPILWRWCPISLADIYLEGFPLPLVNYAVSLIVQLPKPVYIHCQHGEDRTGLVVAAFRIAQGWKPQKAYEEAKQHGYHALLNQGLDKTFRALGASL